MVIINNFNTGHYSRTIVADQVYASDMEIYIPVMLSPSEKTDLIGFIHSFFDSLHPLPEARECLNAFSIKIAHGGLVTYWNSVNQAVSFLQNFRKLLEAAFLISREDRGEFKREKTTKDNLVPTKILAKSRKMVDVLPYLPSSSDPQDSLDPIKNLRYLFADTEPGKLLKILNAWGDCTLSDCRPSLDLQRNLYLYDIIFHIILDSCHLIYVRSPKEKQNSLES
ncbi:hypothetical protein [Aquiflexum sp.]|uniref:hypothetical protein n=1 Tax=Aquiflexum sp. TaxID=1872584 RepID=UPI00359351DC